MSDIVAELTSTLQSASINFHPDPAYDISPSTAASKKQPVHIDADAAAQLEDEIDEGERVRGEEIQISVLQPARRKTTLPPLPDLRFEQSYLASIRDAAERENYVRVGWITVRDQVFLPLIQGMLWTLIISGWRHWNTSAKFNGSNVGARIRRWWWSVNHWKVPEEKLGDRKLAEDVKEFYQSQSSYPGGD